ncbi:hypothetical protein RI367_003822 [Sorochytrium milnesiophthora]
MAATTTTTPTRSVSFGADQQLATPALPPRPTSSHVAVTVAADDEQASDCSADSSYAQQPIAPLQPPLVRTAWLVRTLFFLVCTCFILQVAIMIDMFHRDFVGSAYGIATAIATCLSALCHFYGLWVLLRLLHVTARSRANAMWRYLFLLCLTVIASSVIALLAWTIYDIRWYSVVILANICAVVEAFVTYNSLKSVELHAARARKASATLQSPQSPSSAPMSVTYTGSIMHPSRPSAAARSHSSATLTNNDDAHAMPPVPPVPVMAARPASPSLASTAGTGLGVSLANDSPLFRNDSLAVPSPSPPALPMRPRAASLPMLNIDERLLAVQPESDMQHDARNVA